MVIFAPVAEIKANKRIQTIDLQNIIQNDVD